MKPLTPRVLVAALFCARLFAVPGCADAQEFIMPWEKKLREEKEKAAPLAPEDVALRMEIVLNELDVVRLPQAGVTVISSHPEVAEIYLKNPGFLFMVGRVKGNTTVVVANADHEVIWAGDVEVVSERSEE